MSDKTRNVLIFVGAVFVIVAGLVILNNHTNKAADRVNEYAECQQRLNTGEFTYSEILAMCESKHP